jgi:DNA repair protein RadC
MAFPGAFGRASSDWVKEQMAASGADGYWVLHNHPSGSVKASNADINLTQRLYQDVPGFKGHVIIDHNKYSVSRPAGIYRRPVLDP